MSFTRLSKRPRESLYTLMMIQHQTQELYVLRTYNTEELKYNVVKEETVIIYYSTVVSCMNIILSLIHFL